MLWYNVCMYRTIFIIFVITSKCNVKTVPHNQ